MAFPLDMFITNPRDLPRTSLEGASILGQWGDQMVADRRARAQMAQAESHFQQGKSLQERQLKSVDDYRQDQLDLRKQAMTDKQDHERKVRVNALMDAFKKAKTPKQRELIRQELTSLGQAVTEEDTELPDTDAPKAAPIMSPLDIAPQPKEPGAGMSERTMSQMKPPSGDPFGDPFGGQPPPSGPLDIAPQPKRGGKFSIRDEKGALLSTFDEPLEKDKGRKAVKNILDPMIGMSSNPQEKAAAEMAEQAAIAASESGEFNVREAALFGKGIYDKEMGRFKTERRPGSVSGVGGGGGSLGVGKQEQSRLLGGFNEVMSVARETRQEGVVPKAKEELSNLDHMESLLSNPDNTFENNAALMAHMRTLIGSAQTKSEFANAIGGAGKMAVFERELNMWAGKGRMPDVLRQGLLAVHASRRRTLEKRIDDAVAGAEGFLEDVPGLLTPEERKQGASAIRKIVTGKRGDAGGGASKAQDPGKAAAIAEAKRALAARRGKK